MDSEPFALPAHPGPVLLDARGGSKVGYHIAMGGSIVGIVAVSLGGLFLLASTQANGPDRNDFSGDGSSDERSSLIGAGVVLIGTGIIVGLVSYLAVRRNRMTVEIH